MTSAPASFAASAIGTELKAQKGGPAATPDPDLFARHWVLVEQAIRGVCRRQRFTAEDAEDFTSVVCVRLLEDNCAVLRRFGSRSSLGTYLSAVITHLAQDWRNAQWGKWRPSVVARRRGPIAVHLDRLLWRDGLTLDEACETLQTNYRVRESRSQLENIAAALPARGRRRFVEWTTLEPGNQLVTSHHVFSDPYAEERAHVVVQALTSVLRSLTAEDRLLIKLRFEDGLRVVEIARRLHEPEKPLYRRLERVLSQLRRELENRGVHSGSLPELLNCQGAALADGGLCSALEGADSWVIPPDPRH